MIERFYLRDYLSFKEAELNLKKGIVVFTGPSGSGKSILLKSILSSLGLDSCEASICESSVLWKLDEDIDSDDINVFKHIKKDKSRYFINNQSVSKKSISDISLDYVRYLSLKDFSDFENENLLEILDNRISIKKPQIAILKKEYKEAFFEHKKILQELQDIEEQQKQLRELKEFAKFEIQKIESINPKQREDIELLEIKKELSKKEKSLKSINLANMIFEHERNVYAALDAINVNNSFFSDAMNELRAYLEAAEDRFSALEEVNVEAVLNRIEELSELKRRYGSIEDAISYKEEKKQELKKYENIEITKDDLVVKEALLAKKTLSMAQDLSNLRKDEIEPFKADLNRYLKDLYLRDATIELKETALTHSGKDEMQIMLMQTDLQKISTGEFNRLRLAILALKSEFLSQEGGVLVLDEIDANLSGEESMSVAKVLKHLSKAFQIFTISHQPQLTSIGDQHFLVHKIDEESFVKELESQERVDEIARIISGENITQEAKNFAKELLGIK